MIYCTYNPENNTLLDISTTQPENGTYVGMYREMPDFAVEVWNPAVLNFYTKPDATISKLEYLRRFTQDERIAIRGAAAQSPQLADYLELLTLAEEIRLTDPDISIALSMLEQVGLLAPGRSAEILA